MATNPFLSAISGAEGYGVPGVIPTVNNNPGDLTSNGSIRTFSSAAQGWQALQAQIQSIMSGTSSIYTPNETLTQMGQSWANGDPNWAQNVGSLMGVNPNTTTIAQAYNGNNQAVSDGLASGISMGLGSIGLSNPFASPIASAIASNPSAITSSASSSWFMRGAVGLAGLVSLGAGLFLLRPVQSVVVQAAGAAKAAAAIAA